MSESFGRVLSPREASELKAIACGKKDRQKGLTQDAQRYGAVKGSQWQKWYEHGYLMGDTP